MSYFYSVSYIHKGTVYTEQALQRTLAKAQNRVNEKRILAFDQHQLRNDLTWKRHWPDGPDNGHSWVAYDLDNGFDHTINQFKVPQ